MDGDGPGFVQTGGDDHVAEGPVEPGHLDHVEALVGPVDIPWEHDATRHAKWLCTLTTLSDSTLVTAPQP